MKYIITINNHNYEVEVEKGEAKVIKSNETATVPVIARTLTTTVADPTPQAASAVVLSSGGDTIVAPMPGVILQIKKGAGEQVKKGEAILILEAMKMENEVIAPKDGVIVQMIAAKGATVNTGDVLAVMQ